jgi:hypothetical protein
VCTIALPRRTSRQIKLQLGALKGRRITKLVEAVANDLSAAGPSSHARDLPTSPDARPRRSGAWVDAVNTLTTAGGRRPLMGRTSTSTASDDPTQANHVARGAFRMR